MSLIVSRLQLGCGGIKYVVVSVRLLGFHIREPKFVRFLAKTEHTYSKEIIVCNLLKDIMPGHQNVPKLDFQRQFFYEKNHLNLYNIDTSSCEYLLFQNFIFQNYAKFLSTHLNRIISLEYIQF